MIAHLKIKSFPLVLLASLSVFSGTNGFAEKSAKTMGIHQQLAISAYFDPDCSSNPNCYWEQLDQAIPTVGLAVFGINNGPGNSPSSVYTKQMKLTQSLGGSVIGYVYTSSGKRSITTVESDIDKYYQWYNVDGIFFDEGASSCSKASYYQTLNQYVKAKGGKAITIINQAGNTGECYATISDIIVNYEDTAKNYPKWKPAAWVQKYPASKFWQIIYSTPQASLNTILLASSNNNAGWIYVTPNGGSNPYGTLPTGTYWTTEVTWAQNS